MSGRVYRRTNMFVLCPDAFVVVYAVVDRESYDSACNFLYDLRKHRHY